MEAFPGGDRNLFVQRIAETAPRSLSVVLAEARVSPHEEDIGFSDLKGYRLTVDSACRLIEVTWNRVVAHLVLNESYTSVGPALGKDGKPLSMLEVIENSAFIDYLKQISFADNTFPGPLMHYRLCSLTHIIDVVCVESPTFRKVVG